LREAHGKAPLNVARSASTICAKRIDNTKPRAILRALPSERRFSRLPVD
jgi:hypothetical protein